MGCGISSAPVAPNVQATAVRHELAPTSQTQQQLSPQPAHQQQSQPQQQQLMYSAPSQQHYVQAPQYGGQSPPQWPQQQQQLQAQQWQQQPPQPQQQMYSIPQQQQQPVQQQQQQIYQPQQLWQRPQGQQVGLTPQQRQQQFEQYMFPQASHQQQQQPQQQPMQAPPSQTRAIAVTQTVDMSAPPAQPPQSALPAPVTAPQLDVASQADAQAAAVAAQQQAASAAAAAAAEAEAAAAAQRAREAQQKEEARVREVAAAAATAAATAVAVQREAAARVSQPIQVPAHAAECSRALVFETTGFVTNKFHCELCNKGGSGELYTCNSCAWSCHPSCFSRNGGVDTENAPVTGAPNGGKPWSPRGMPHPFPQRPYQFGLGAKAARLVEAASGRRVASSTPLQGGAFNALTAKFPSAATSADAFFASFQRVVLLDVRRLSEWSVGSRVDESLNAIVWAAVFEAAAQGETGYARLAAEGILCCRLEDVPRSDSVFLSHRWSVAGGVCSMSPAFLQAYVLFACKIANGDQPCWLWLDLLCVPQLTPRPAQNHHAFTYSSAEVTLRAECNAAYMRWVGLRFGSIATSCQHFFHHQNLSTIVDYYQNPMRREVTAYDFEVQRLYWRDWGMDERFALFDDEAAATQAGMSCLYSIKTEVNFGHSDHSHLFFTDLSYCHRIWCLAEFVVRLLGRSTSDFIDVTAFYAALWNQTGPKDLQHRTDGVIKRPVEGGERNLELEAMDLQHRHELTAAFVTESLQGFAATYRGQAARTQQTQLVCSVLSLEGLVSVVGAAAATQVRDVPLVLEVLFRSLCAQLFGTAADAPVPAPIARMVDWCVQCGACAPRCAADGSAEAMAAREQLQRKFHEIVDPASGLLKDYLECVRPYFSQGANSLFMLERIAATLALNGRPVGAAFDAAAYASMPAAPCAVPRLDDAAAAALGPGFAFAPTACWLLNKLGLDVRAFFSPPTDDDDTRKGNLAYMDDWGADLAATQNRRWTMVARMGSRGMPEPGPVVPFPGHPVSEWLFARVLPPASDGGGDPLAHFQSLSPATHAGACVWRPVHGIGARQAEVGHSWNGVKRRFDAEHVTMQLDGRVEGRSVATLDEWAGALERDTFPLAIRAAGSRRITLNPLSTSWPGGPATGDTLSQLFGSAAPFAHSGGATSVQTRSFQSSDPAAMMAFMSSTLG